MSENQAFPTRSFGKAHLRFREQHTEFGFKLDTYDVVIDAVVVGEVYRTVRAKRRGGLYHPGYTLFWTHSLVGTDEDEFRSRKAACMDAVDHWEKSAVDV